MANLLSRPAAYLTSAEETLALSSKQRGQGGMQRTAALPGANALDNGPASKVAVNTQPYNNALMQKQSLNQNYTTAVSGAQADALMDVRRQQLAVDNQKFTAERFAKQRTAEVASVLGSPAIQQMGMMNNLELAKLRNDNAVGVAQAMGVSPALMQNAMNASRYSA